jgi:hypothetical protein
MIAVTHGPLCARAPRIGAGPYILLAGNFKTLYTERTVVHPVLTPQAGPGKKFSSGGNHPRLQEVEPE